MGIGYVPIGKVCSGIVTPHDKLHLGNNTIGEVKSIEVHLSVKKAGSGGDFIGLLCKSTLLRRDWKEVKVLGNINEKPLHEVFIFLAKVLVEVFKNNLYR